MVLCEGFRDKHVHCLGWSYNDRCFTAGFSKSRLGGQGCFEANILKRLNSSFDSNDTSLGFPNVSMQRFPSLWSPRDTDKDAPQMNFGDVTTESCLFVFDELHIKTEPWTPRENNDQGVKQKHV